MRLDFLLLIKNHDQKLLLSCNGNIQSGSLINYTMITIYILVDKIYFGPQDCMSPASHMIFSFASGS